VNESVLQDLLGHAAGSKVTRKYYIQVPDDARRAAVIQLPIGERKDN
jgi:integrase